VEVTRETAGTLIDSSVLIAVERGLIDLAAFGDADDEEPLAMAAITASELLHGVHRLKGAVARTRAERFVERILAAIPVIPFDLDIARVHARIDAELSAAGTTIGDGDLMIGATAVWLDYRVATRDLRSLPKIKGLPVVRW
jgi:predicted nucleic acid-binding protein